MSEAASGRESPRLMAAQDNEALEKVQTIDPRGSGGADKQNVREALERRQIVIYCWTVAMAAVVAALVPATRSLEAGVNPSLAMILFATSLQVPFADFRRALSRIRFLAPLLLVNFLVVPLLVAVLVQFLAPRVGGAGSGPGAASGHRDIDLDRTPGERVDLCALHR